MSTDMDTWAKAGEAPRASAARRRFLVRKLLGMIFMSRSKP
jgi:hypothetical protein